MKRYWLPAALVIVGSMIPFGSVQAQMAAPASIDSLVDLNAATGGLTGTWSVREDYAMCGSGIFTATWTFTPLVGNISRVHAVRPTGDAVDGIEISPAQLPVDIVVHPSYGGGAGCKYVFVGSASSTSYSGNVNYQCSGSSCPGTFSATRISNMQAPAPDIRGVDPQ